MKRTSFSKTAAALAAFSLVLALVLTGCPNASGGGNGANGGANGDNGGANGGNGANGANGGANGGSGSPVITITVTGLDYCDAHGGSPLPLVGGMAQMDLRDATTGFGLASSAPSAGGLLLEVPASGVLEFPMFLVDGPSGVPFATEGTFTITLNIAISSGDQQTRFENLEVVIGNNEVDFAYFLPGFWP